MDKILRLFGGSEQLWQYIQKYAKTAGVEGTRTVLELYYVLKSPDTPGLDKTIIVAALVLIVVAVAGVNNRAISLEEQISGAEAQISVAEKRRVDLIYNLVDTVTAYQEYEGETMLAITEARASAQAGDADGAMTVLNAVSEQYPELKANENYQQLMTELAMTENSIAQYRNNYNEQVKAYNKFVRQFPNNIILGIMGYAPIETQNTDYDAPEDAPSDLFGE